MTPDISFMDGPAIRPGEIDHTDECELDVDGTSGLCTCNFVKRVREAGRARDYVKCVDPECSIHKDWAKHHHACCAGSGLKPNPHCHPVFEAAP